MRRIAGLEGLGELVGQRIGQSPWVTVDQPTIQGFADVTHDHNWIHVDPHRAGNSTFGSTIAHGFYTLSLIGGLMQQVFVVKNTTALNYGVGKVRFPQAVPVNSRLQLSIDLADLTPQGLDRVDVRYSCTVSIDGEEKPACAAEILFRYFRAD